MWITDRDTKTYIKLFTGVPTFFNSAILKPRLLIVSICSTPQHLISSSKTFCLWWCSPPIDKAQFWSLFHCGVAKQTRLWKQEQERVCQIKCQFLQVPMLTRFSEDPMVSNINQEANEGIIESQHVQVSSRACTKRDSWSISSFCFPSLGSLYTLLQLHHLAKPTSMEKEVHHKLSNRRDW